MKTKIYIPFIKYRFWLIALSSLLALVSIGTIATRGFNYGIDFRGGAKLQYRFSQPVTEEEIRGALTSVGLTDISVVRFGNTSENRMSVKVGLPEEHAKIGDMITPALEKAFGAGNAMLEQEQTVGPRVGQELRKKAWLTILFSWVLMLIYIGYRFDFFFAPGAIVALMHDVLITLGLFSFLGKEVNLTILAAVLTLIGYSNNDTIVVFDRIRENKHRITPTTIWDVVNDAINSTLSRTIITSLTVFIVVLLLFLMGGGTLHDLSFTLIVGVIVGTYSSIFIASPIYIGLYHYWPKIHSLWAKR